MDGGGGARNTAEPERARSNEENRDRLRVLAAVASARGSIDM